MTIVEIMAEKGLAVAMAEWRSRRAPLAQERDRLVRELRSVEQDLLALDGEFAAASQQAQQSDSLTDVGGAFAVDRPSSDVVSVREFVLDLIGHNGGRMKSRKLYPEAERHGKQRSTIYATVSKLIRDGVLKKIDLPGERGCILELTDKQQQHE